MVKTSPFNARGMGSIPGWEIKIPRLAAKKPYKKRAIVANSRKTLKMVQVKKKKKKKNLKKIKKH